MDATSNTIEVNYRRRDGAIGCVTIHWVDYRDRPGGAQEAEAILNAIPRGAELLHVRQYPEAEMGTEAV